MAVLVNYRPREFVSANRRIFIGTKVGGGLIYRRG